jgi:hypothetical protein
MRQRRPSRLTENGKWRSNYKSDQFGLVIIASKLLDFWGQARNPPTSKGDKMSEARQMWKAKKLVKFEAYAGSPGPKPWNVLKSSGFANSRLAITAKLRHVLSLLQSSKRME